MPEVPKLLLNGWLVGPTVPSECSSGNSPEFLDSATGVLYACINDTYQPVAVNTTPVTQSPWTGDIDAAGFTLINVSQLSVGEPGTKPLSVITTGVNQAFFIQDLGSGVNPGLTVSNDVGSSITLGAGGSTAGAPRQNNAYISYNGGALIWQAGGELMRLNTIGLGVANINPQFKVDVTGDVNVTGQYLVDGLPLLALASNFLDDVAAAAGGIPLGGLYHNAGAVRIRIA